jgi:TolB-like protein/DNA-binding winged helix-turn-helix (wHTH) protein/Tfp pilus assembly protein PilF
MASYTFGPFQLDLGRRLLLRGGVPIALSSRAFDILHLLIENRERVVTKHELMSRVWRGVVVEENNLAVQISALRRALSETGSDAHYILTVPGQGYRFVGTLADEQELAPATPAGVLTIPQRDDAFGEGTTLVSVATGGQEVLPPSAVAPPAKAPSWPWAILALAGGTLAVIIAAISLLPPRTPPVPPKLPPPRLSIAVLPFRDLSDIRCCEYLADAVTDDLTTDLSHIPESVVIARESAEVYRGQAKPTQEIGDALNVRYLLEGDIRKVDQDLLVNAELIEASTGGHLWAERFKVGVDKLAEAQNDIVTRLASALGVQLVGLEGAESFKRRNTDPDALDLFFRARSILDRSDTLKALSEAQALLEQAIAKKPDFSDALAELAWLLPRKAAGASYPTVQKDLDEAHRIVERALQATPVTPLALAAKGALAMADGHAMDSLASYQAALALDPNSVPALTGLLVTYSRLGRFNDVLSGLDALMRIDPEGPRVKARYLQRGFAELMTGHPEEAISALEKSLVADPNTANSADALSRSDWGRLLLIAAYDLAGQRHQAREAYADYSASMKNRTAWHLWAQLSREQAALPESKQLIAAWVDAGMPAFADEHAGPDVPVKGQRGEFVPTPATAPGARTMDTAGLRKALDGNGIWLLDFGRGAAVPPRAQLIEAPPSSASAIQAAVPGLDDALRQAVASGGKVSIIVMGTGPCDWSAWQAAQTLSSQTPGADVAWYRGGEEAWAASGLNADSHRPL